MATPVVPPPPPGFSLDSTPPPPPGFELDSAAPKTPEEQTPTNAGETVGGQLKRVAGAATETPLHALTGMIATPVAGVIGAAEAPFVGGEKAAKDIEGIQSDLTYSPKTEGGKLGVQGLDMILGLIPKAGRKAGDVALKLTGSPAVAAAVDTGVQMLPAAFGAKGAKGLKPGELPKPDPMREAAYEAQQEGLVLPANQARPNLLNNLADSISGKLKTQQLASLKNQGSIQTLVKRGLGIKSDTEWSPGLPDAVIKESGKAYEALKDPSLPRVHPGTAFYNELNDVLGDYTEAGRTFKESAKSPIQENVRALAKDIRDAKGFDPASGMAMARILRDRASAAFQKGEKAEGMANKRMATALEDEIERSLPKDKPDLIKNFRAARQRIAQAHDVKSAMNPVTGNIDARVLGKLLKKGTPFTGDLAKAARFGSAFPKAAQLPEMIGDYADYSPLDYGVGIMAEAAQKAAQGNMTEASAIFSRAPLRHAILSKWYQEHLGKAPTPDDLIKIAKSMARRPAEKKAMLLSDVAAQGSNQ
jgi:hypothetical protein